MRRFWNWLRSPFARWSASAILAAWTIALAVMWGGFTTALEYTNTPDFCMSCHEMGSNVGAEWQESVHYRNVSGVRATCADCHVPKELGPKLLRKLVAAKDVYHHLLGTIDTSEKFNDRRAEMAEMVWARMKADDSHTCRSCHSPDAMDFHKQSQRAQEKMKPGLEEGKTCIECHIGVAHKRPPRDD